MTYTFCAKFPYIGTVYIGSPPSQTSSSGKTSHKRYVFILLSCVSSWIHLLTFRVSHLIIPSAGDVSQPYTSFLLWKVRGGVNIWVRQRSREAEGSRISSRRHVGLISRSWPLLSCHHVIAGPRLCWRLWIWGHVWVESLCGRFRPGQWQQCAPIMCMRLRAHANFYAHNSVGSCCWVVMDTF